MAPSPSGSGGSRGENRPPAAPAASSLRAKRRSSLDSGSAKTASPERRHETQLGGGARLHDAEPRDRPAEPGEQAELVEAAPACVRQAQELGEDTLARRLGHQMRVTADELLGRRVDAQLELVLQASGPEQPERIVRERPVVDGAQPVGFEITAAVEGSIGSPAGAGRRSR